MPQRIGLNLLRPQGVPTQLPQYNTVSLNTTLNQGQFSNLSYGMFNTMINRVANSKPGCSSCGK
jgi:hypothetical protein